MYVEKREIGNAVKYYLAHSYREKDKVKKIRIYLGCNLSKKELEGVKKRAKEKMNELLEKINTDVFLFSLTNKQIDVLNKFNDKINITRFSEAEWRNFTEDFVYDTNAIEGSTVTEKEVPEILRKKRAENEEEIEVKGVAKAVDYIRKTKEDFSLSLLLKLHDLCFKGSKNFAGKFRDVEVVIKNSMGQVIHAGVPKRELKDYLEDFVEWYNKNKDKFKPLILAAIMHNQFEHIHPFQDGNGRVGRLLLNFILLKKEYPPINIMLEDRFEYYQVLRKYSKHDDIKSTLIFLIKQYRKTLKEVTTKRKDKKIVGTKK